MHIPSIRCICIYTYIYVIAHLDTYNSSIFRVAISARLLFQRHIWMFYFKAYMLSTNSGVPMMSTIIWLIDVDSNINA